MFVSGSTVDGGERLQDILHLARRDDFAIVVTSPNSNVFLGASEQMTATASDGRALAGTWGSDNPSAVSVNAATGLVTAVSAGQANIFFIADGRQGTKLIRALPNLAGKFAGNYLVIRAVRRPVKWRRQTSATRPAGQPWSPYTFMLAQTGPVLTGRVLVLGTDAVPAFADDDWRGRGCQREWQSDRSWRASSSTPRGRSHRRRQGSIDWHHRPGVDSAGRAGRAGEHRGYHQHHHQNSDRRQLVGG